MVMMMVVVMVVMVWWWWFTFYPFGTPTLLPFCLFVCRLFFLHFHGTYGTLLPYARCLSPICLPTLLPQCPGWAFSSLLLLLTMAAGDIHIYYYPQC